MVAVPGESLASLDLGCPELWAVTAEHCIVAVGGKRNCTPRELAEELCRTCEGRQGGEESTADRQVVIEVQSPWLMGGAELILEDLRVGYRDIPRDILQDVNLHVKAQSKVGIVGRTGCGKSSLMLSLLRIIEPRRGRILLNQVDLQTLGLKTLRTSVGMVPQDPILLEGSVRDNVDPFGCFTDQEVMDGLRMVQLEDAVSKMEGGLYTEVSAEGSNLSFGQRQLICLARVVVRQPPLLLLDEATSALDPFTQEMVQSTVQHSFPKSTIVVIAHRLETIMDFDMIVVMDKGRIVESGSVKALCGTEGGLFAGMVASKRTY